MLNGHRGVGKVQLENNKVKAKSQVPVKIHKSDLIGTVYLGFDNLFIAGSREWLAY